MNVSVGIDYLQFSLEVPPRTFGGMEIMHDQAMMENVLKETMQQHAKMYLTKIWRVADNGMTPYSHGFSLFDRSTGLRFANLYYSAKNIDTVLIQHTGQGCSLIPNMLDLLSYVQPRVGRLDIAIDVETNENPTEYHAAYTGRLSTSITKSPTGETFYLGSQKSDKYLRVYRYAPPHERAHLLRFETQYRREYARGAAWHIGQMGLREFALAALKDYDLPTSHITEGAGEAPFISRKANSDTITWLNRQVKPALRRLINSGEFDARAWVEEIYND